MYFDADRDHIGDGTGTRDGSVTNDSDDEVALGNRGTGRGEETVNSVRHQRADEADDTHGRDGDCKAGPRRDLRKIGKEAPQRQAVAGVK